MKSSGRVRVGDCGMQGLNMRRSGLGSRAGSGLGVLSVGSKGSSLDPHCPVELFELFGGVSDMVTGCWSCCVYGGVL